MGMVAVCALYNVQRFGNDHNRRGKRKGTAIKGTVRKSFSGFQWKQHFLPESLIVHIAGDPRKLCVIDEIRQYER